jgi:hypothetical protein
MGNFFEHSIVDCLSWLDEAFVWIIVFIKSKGSRPGCLFCLSMIVLVASLSCKHHAHDDQHGKRSNE